MRHSRVAWIALLLAIIAVVVALGMAYGASFLRVNAPEHADVIVVMGGGPDDSRYYRAAELMHAGYADRILLDAEAFGRKFGKTGADLAGEFLADIHAENTIVCPVYHDSTYGETEDVARCLAPLKVSSALIVSSDYHTRRAFSIFKARLPQYHWSVACSYAPVDITKPQRMAGDAWWKNRRWAKTILEEWEKLIWWELIDRWRPHLIVRDQVS